MTWAPVLSHLVHGRVPVILSTQTNDTTTYGAQGTPFDPEKFVNGMDESYSITSMKGLVCAEERSEVYDSRQCFILTICNFVDSTLCY